MICSGVPCGHDPAAQHAGARPQVDDPVGGAHRLLVVLDDQHGVAHVAQLLQRVQQAAVVALVQADARLVEDVEHAHQPAADLAGQADALPLAARQRRRRAVQRQVVQAHVEHELQPVADLFQHLFGDLELLGGQGWLRDRDRRSAHPAG